MSTQLAFLLLIGITGGNAAPTTGAMDSSQHFDNYTEAYWTATQVNRPMLVILNPDSNSEKKPISLADVRKTKRRRELLENYVVVVLDTETSHGRVCHELFGSTALPRVVVIDKDQRYQIFGTSEQMYGQRWTEILTTFQTGHRTSEMSHQTQHEPQSQYEEEYCPT